MRSTAFFCACLAAAFLGYSFVGISASTVALAGPTPNPVYTLKTYVPPQKPINLTATTQQKPPQITLNWQSAGPAFIKWAITRTPGPFPTQQVSQQLSTFTDMTAAAGVQYSYQVCAANLCATVNARIRPDPVAPGGVGAIRLSDSQVGVGWNTGDEGTDFFRVQQKLTSWPNWVGVGNAKLPASTSHLDIFYPAHVQLGPLGYQTITSSFKNADLLIRVCAGNDVGTLVCSAPVSPQASYMIPVPMQPSPTPTPQPSAIPPPMMPIPHQT